MSALGCMQLAAMLQLPFMVVHFQYLMCPQAGCKQIPFARQVHFRCIKLLDVQLGEFSQEDSLHTGKLDASGGCVLPCRNHKVTMFKIL